MHLRGPLHRDAQLNCVDKLKSRSGNAGSSAMVGIPLLHVGESRLRHATKLKARRHFWWPRRSFGEISPFHSSSERADVKLVERTRNLSDMAWFRQPSPIHLVMGTDSNSSAIWMSLIDTQFAFL
jgi:hypothetical protein